MAAPIDSHAHLERFDLFLHRSSVHDDVKVAPDLHRSGLAHLHLFDCRWSTHDDMKSAPGVHRAGIVHLDRFDLRWCAHDCVQIVLESTRTATWCLTEAKGRAPRRGECFANGTDEPVCDAGDLRCYIDQLGLWGSIEKLNG